MKPSNFPRTFFFSLSLLWLGILISACGDREAGEALEESSEEEEGEAIAAVQVDWKSPETCRSCHAEAYANWLNSHHAKANRPFDPEQDAEAYSAGEVEDAAGRTFRIAATEDSAGIAELDAEGHGAIAYVKGIIGTYPLQQPLMEDDRGRLQAHTMAWDPEKKEWFNVFGGEERLVGEWGHWTGQGMNWNSNCAWCHMTEYEKNYDPLTDTYASTWHAHGIACIRCHEGAETHVSEALAGAVTTKIGLEVPAAMENCASCHARREGLTDGAFEAGDRFDDHFRLLTYDHPTAYFPDGKASEEDFVYGSFVHSNMGHKGVNCFDCHEPHSNSLILPVENNALCVQCHSTGNKEATIIDQLTHSRHDPSGAGASCIECHMPERDYMARDPRRDHGFTIPDPHMTEAYGTPNACASCHEDMSNAELLAQFDAWYGESPRVVSLRERAAVLDEAWSGVLVSPDPIFKLIEETENLYWKASGLRLLRPFAGDKRVKDLAATFAESELPLLRDAAIYVLRNNPEGLPFIQDALADAALTVRLQAADALAYNGILSPADEAEYVDYLMANADRPSGALRLADLWARRGDPQQTLHYVDLAISFDRRNAPLRYDGAIMLDRVGLVEEAIQRLRVANGYDSSSGLYLYSIGLLQGEQGLLLESAKSIRRALQIEPQQDRWWFNLAVVEFRTGDIVSARVSLARALELAPDNPEYQSFSGQIN